MKDISENLDDIENIPTIITNIHNRIKKEDNKNNYYSELKLDKDIYNMTTANNYNKNYIYNLINTGLSSYECVCGPRKIRDESKINFSENQINHIIKEILRCPICYEIFNDPVNLKNCLHLFCKKCIEDYNRKIKKECIICRHPIETRRLMKNDFKIKNIIECIIPDINKFNIEEEKILNKTIQGCMYKDGEKVIKQIENIKKTDEEEKIKELENNNDKNNLKKRKKQFKKTQKIKIKKNIITNNNNINNNNNNINNNHNNNNKNNNDNIIINNNINNINNNINNNNNNNNKNNHNNNINNNNININNNINNINNKNNNNNINTNNNNNDNINNNNNLEENNNILDKNSLDKKEINLNKEQIKNEKIIISIENKQNKKENLIDLINNINNKEFHKKCSILNELKNNSNNNYKKKNFLGKKIYNKFTSKNAEDLLKNFNKGNNIIINLNLDENEKDESLKKSFENSKLKIQDYYNLDFITKFILFKQNFKLNLNNKKIIYYTKENDGKKKYWLKKNITIKNIVNHYKNLIENDEINNENINLYHLNSNSNQYYLKLYFEIKYI